MIMGESYASLRLADTADGIKLQLVECIDADKGTDEKVLFEESLQDDMLPVPFSNV